MVNDETYVLVPWCNFQSMPPTSTDLELFILALVQRDSATPYDLKAKAAISVVAARRSTGSVDQVHHCLWVDGIAPILGLELLGRRKRSGFRSRRILTNRMDC